jgi:hypothetical protein
MVQCISLTFWLLLWLLLLVLLSFSLSLFLSLSQTVSFISYNLQFLNVIVVNKSYHVIPDHEDMFRYDNLCYMIQL